MTILSIDLVLSFLIGPPDGAGSFLLIRAALGLDAGDFAIYDLTLFCAMSSIRPGDQVDHERFAKLLGRASMLASSARNADGTFPTPTQQEIEHWRTLALRRLENFDERVDALLQQA